MGFKGPWYNFNLSLSSLSIGNFDPHPPLPCSYRKTQPSGLWQHLYNGLTYLHMAQTDTPACQHVYYSESLQHNLSVVSSMRLIFAWQLLSWILLSLRFRGFLRCFWYFSCTSLYNEPFQNLQVGHNEGGRLHFLSLVIQIHIAIFVLQHFSQWVATKIESRFY